VLCPRLARVGVCVELRYTTWFILLVRLVYHRHRRGEQMYYRIRPIPSHERKFN
jgi:hypothetical protein